MFGLYFKRLMIFQLVSFADTFYGEIEFPPKKNLIESGNTTTRLADKEGEKERKTSLSKKQNNNNRYNE